MQSSYGSMLAMDSSHPWASNVGKSNMHPAMHGCVAITDDPNKYHVTGFGTVLPHLPPGMSGGGSRASGQMEIATGDGASPGFNTNAPAVVFLDPEDPATGEGAKGVINHSKISTRDVEVVMADNTKLDEKMVKLAQISQEDTGHYSELGPLGSPGGEGVRGMPAPPVSQPASIQQFSPSRDYAFEQALRGRPAMGNGFDSAPRYYMSQPEVPPALYAVLEQQTELLKMMQDRAGLTEKKQSDFQPYSLADNKHLKPAESDEKVGDYGHIGLPWLKDPPEAPKVTVVFSFGRLTHKAKFHDVSVRQCGQHRCLYLAIDERFEGAMTFPDPSDEPFRVIVPEKDLDLIVYDADIRLDCGGKLTFIVLLEAGEEYAG